MILFTLADLGLAIGHHEYYSALNRALVGSNERQQWARNIGNIFAVLFVATLHAANSSAYNQYFWVVVREKGFSIAALDKLFSLTSDPSGFFRLEVLGKATVATLLACATWMMAWAGVLPPGTLTVVPGIVNEQHSVSMSTFDWSSTSWTVAGIHKDPSAVVISVGNRAAEAMEIIPVTPLAANSSYMIPIQDHTCNSTSLRIFTNATSGNATADLANGQNMLFYAAFDPTMRIWFHGTDDDDDPFGIGPERDPDLYNDWHVSLPADFLDTSGYLVADDDAPDYVWRMVPRQLWIQTAEKSILCTLGNGTRDVNFAFVDGVQTITYGPLQDFEALFVPLLSYLSGMNEEIFLYVSVYMSLINMLNGNVTTTIPAWQAGLPQSVYTESINDHSSRILLTGLDACDDFTQSTFNLHPLHANETELGNNTPASIFRYEGIYPDPLFMKPGWMCRNRTLDRVIEDLATNITISMMTSPQLLKPNSTSATVSFSPTRNVYNYNPFYLFFSYGLALLFTLFSLTLGLYAFISNGLDLLSKGNSLGALPKNKSMKKVRLRFGGVDSGEEYAAFGAVERVRKLRRGMFDCFQVEGSKLSLAGLMPNHGLGTRKFKDIGSREKCTQIALRPCAPRCEDGSSPSNNSSTTG
ncbi:uncharacterized protein PAC_18747 [Phialocephala subalpina]|uniref:Uncharacterized protein n=1 Tax=Phialocephala subalpina TaxID=576137 RepID=A0A1L7XV15_9HELO|nr:uncharacterized protein PAC_18747 [Phialocephala subalpina]